jgi:hypothetical protein
VSTPCAWHKTTAKGQRRIWYRCIHRDRVFNKRLCEAKSVRAEPLHRTVFEATMDGLTMELPALMEDCRTELLQQAALVRRPPWVRDTPNNPSPRRIHAE